MDSGDGVQCFLSNHEAYFLASFFSPFSISRKRTLCCFPLFSHERRSNSFGTQFPFVPRAETEFLPLPDPLRQILLRPTQGSKPSSVSSPLLLLSTCLLLRFLANSNVSRAVVQSCSLPLFSARQAALLPREHQHGLIAELGEHLFFAVWPTSSLSFLGWSGMQFLF